MTDSEIDALLIAHRESGDMRGFARAVADAAGAERNALRAVAARYRLLASLMVHVSHPAGSGWTLDEVLVSGDRDLDDVIDALAEEPK